MSARGLLSAALALCAPAAALGAPVAWRVLPARGERPPPRDPTLMRLTESIAEALGAALEQPVPIADEALALEACPAGGACPRDLALLVQAQRAVVIELKADQSAVELTVYGRGVERRLALPCKWERGLVRCEGEGLAALKSANAPPPEAARPGPASGSPSADDPVERALAAIDRRARRCLSKGWGELPTAERPKAMSVRFRALEDGSVRDVRLDPPGFTDVPALACMARVVESLELPVGVFDGSTRQRALPLP